MSESISRRNFLAASAGGLALTSTAEAATVQPAPKNPPTRFQVACMTLPYSQFPLQRALTGLRNAGYAHVAWGTTHLEDGKRVPILARDAPVGRAKDLSSRCRDMGLEPVMMFSDIYPEAKDGFQVLRQRILQAAAGRESGLRRRSTACRRWRSTPPARPASAARSAGPPR